MSLNGIGANPSIPQSQVPTTGAQGAGGAQQAVESQSTSSSASIINNDDLQLVGTSATTPAPPAGMSPPTGGTTATPDVQRAAIDLRGIRSVSPLEVLLTMASMPQVIRKAEFQGMQAQLALQFQSLMNSGQKLRDAAKQEFYAALTNAITQGVSGAVSIGGGVMGLRAMSKAGSTPDVESTPQAGKTGASATGGTKTNGVDIDEGFQMQAPRARSNATVQTKPGSAAGVDDGFQMQAPRDRSNAIVQTKPAGTTGAGSTADDVTGGLGNLDPAVQTASAKAQAYSGIAGGVSSMVTGVGTGIAGMFTYDQKNFEADAKEADAEATKAQARYQQAVDFFQNAGQLQTSLASAVEKMLSTQTDTSNKIIGDLRS